MNKKDLRRLRLGVAGKRRRRQGPARLGLLLGVIAALLLAPSAASATILPLTISENTTLTPAGSPYTGPTTIEAGATVTIEPDVVVSDANFTVKGTLKAQGTAEDPIVFNGGNDRAAVIFEPGSGASVLDHVEVVDSGRLTTCCGKTRPSIWIKGSSPTVVNSTIRKSRLEGIKVEGGGGPEIAGNLIVDSYDRAIDYWASEAAHTGQINIHDNVVEGGGSGINVNAVWNSSIGGKALGGNTVIGTKGVGLRFEGPAIPGNITGNTLVGNAVNRIEIGGTVAASSTWSDGGVPIKVNSGVTVASGVTLTIGQGVYLMNPSMTVKGTLKTEGTMADPVVFTGENRLVPGEWANIKFEAGSGASVIDHTEVAYGGSPSSSGMIEAKGSHPTILNSTIRKAKYFGIKVTESGSPKIEWNRFRANPTGLSYAGTGKLVARNNDWGCASGPKPAGCGDSISGSIEWKPAVQLPELNGHCRGWDSQCGEGADPVSLATGHLSYVHRDLLLTNKSGMPLEFVRAYSSDSGADTGLGPGWSQTGLASATELESGAVLVLRQDGRQDLFYKTTEGTYKAPSGVTDSLAKVEGVFQLTTLEGSVYRFDASGRIASVADDHGLKTTYGYNAGGLLTTVTDPSAQTLTFSYNASNHITSVKDSTGREVKYTYSTAGDLATVTDALGGVTEYGYDSQHRITSIKDPRGNVILKNTYDPQGRIVEQRDGLENLWKLEYKEGETVVTEPEGGELAYGFDSQSRVVSETDQLGHKTTTAYDAAGNISEVVEPGGAKWVFGYDAGGNLVSVEDPEGGEREYEYDAQNRLTSFTDALGSTWNYMWSANNLTTIVDPEEGETILTYSESGQPLTVTDPNGHKSEFSYDARGNRLTATDPLGNKTSLGYNSRNHPISKTRLGLKAETFERDALGSLIARTTPEGHKTKYAYDANGMPTQVTDPAENVWKIERNAMERPTVYTDPLGQQTKVAYNGNLKPVEVINRRGKKTTYGYDLANRLVAVDGPEGGDWAYGYDSRGNRSSMLDPRSKETIYEYDGLDRMIKSIEPLSTTTEYGYDATGNLISVTDPRGNQTSYGYDKVGRLLEIAQPLEKTTSFTYDAAGNPLTRATAAGTLEYEHDAADRLVKVTDGESILRSYGYDTAGRLTSAVDAEGHEIEIGHNEEGLPSSIDDGRGQSLTRAYDPRGKLLKQVDGRGTLEYGYDKLGRITSLTDPQGKALSFGYGPEGELTEIVRPNGVVTTNVYDDAGRLAETTSESAEPATVLESLEYSYDAAGNVTNKLDRRLEAETGYAYDALNRLTEFNPPGEGATSYGYDAAGNRTQAGGTTYTYNALDQLTEASNGATYSYDGAGRLTTQVEGSEETTFDWDLFDHLAKAQGSGGSVTYAFDGLERVSERKSGEVARVFHYGDLGDMTTYEADGEGKTITSYVQGPGGLVEQRSAESTSFPLADAHGDVTAISDSAGGVESRQSFDPWGKQLSGPALQMGYLGAWERPTDPASGLIQMGARSYNPSLGAFATEDPVLGHLAIGVSVNRYPYAWDNPLNRYDLDGRDAFFGAPICFVNCAPEETEEAVVHAAESAAGTGAEAGSKAGALAEEGWNTTSSWVGDRAQDFWKYAGGPITDVYNFMGAHWQTCVEGATAGAAAGATVGSAAGPAGSVAGARFGAPVGCFDAVQVEVLIEIASQ